MKYDVDLQEMDAIRCGRNVYVEEMLWAVEEDGKKNVAVENKEKEKERDKERRGRIGRRTEIYAGDYYATDTTSESCLS